MTKIVVLVLVAAAVVTGVPVPNTDKNSPDIALMLLNADPNENNIFGTPDISSDTITKELPTEIQLDEMDVTTVQYNVTQAEETTTSANKQNNNPVEEPIVEQIVESLLDEIILEPHGDIIEDKPDLLVPETIDQQIYFPMQERVMFNPAAPQADAVSKTFDQDLNAHFVGLHEEATPLEEQEPGIIIISVDDTIPKPQEPVAVEDETIMMYQEPIVVGAETIQIYQEPIAVEAEMQESENIEPFLFINPELDYDSDNTYTPEVEDGTIKDNQNENEHSLILTNEFGLPLVDFEPISVIEEAYEENIDEDLDDIIMPVAVDEVERLEYDDTIDDIILPVSVDEIDSLDYDEIVDDIIMPMVVDEVESLDYNENIDEIILPVAVAEVDSLRYDDVIDETILPVIIDEVDSLRYDDVIDEAILPVVIDEVDSLEYGDDSYEIMLPVAVDEVVEDNTDEEDRLIDEIIDLEQALEAAVEVPSNEEEIVISEISRPDADQSEMISPGTIMKEMFGDQWEYELTDEISPKQMPRLMPLLSDQIEPIILDESMDVNDQFIITQSGSDLQNVFPVMDNEEPDVISMPELLMATDDIPIPDEDDIIEEIIDDMDVIEPEVQPPFEEIIDDMDVIEPEVQPPFVRPPLVFSPFDLESEGIIDQESVVPLIVYNPSESPIIAEDYPENEEEPDFLPPMDENQFKFAFLNEDNIDPIELDIYYDNNDGPDTLDQEEIGYLPLTDGVTNVLKELDGTLPATNVPVIQSFLDNEYNQQENGIPLAQFYDDTNVPFNQDSIIPQNLVPPYSPSPFLIIVQTDNENSNNIIPSNMEATFPFGDQHPIIFPSSTFQFSNNLPIFPKRLLSENRFNLVNSISENMPNNDNSDIDVHSFVDTTKNTDIIPVPDETVLNRDSVNYSAPNDAMVQQLQTSEDSSYTNDDNMNSNTGFNRFNLNSGYLPPNNEPMHQFGSQSFSNSNINPFDSTSGVQFPPSGSNSPSVYDGYTPYSSDYNNYNTGYYSGYGAGYSSGYGPGHSSRYGPGHSSVNGYGPGHSSGYGTAYAGGYAPSSDYMSASPSYDRHDYDYYDGNDNTDFGNYGSRFYGDYQSPDQYYNHFSKNNRHALRNRHYINPFLFRRPFHFF